MGHAMNWDWVADSGAADLVKIWFPVDGFGGNGTGKQAQSAEFSQIMTARKTQHQIFTHAASPPDPPQSSNQSTTETTHIHTASHDFGKLVIRMQDSKLR